MTPTDDDVRRDKNVTPQDLDWATCDAADQLIAEIASDDSTAVRESLAWFVSMVRPLVEREAMERAAKAANETTTCTSQSYAAVQDAVQRIRSLIPPVTP